MDTLAILAIAMALAMDAFAVAVAAGVQLRIVGFRQTFRLSWHFGLFQAMMPVIGWFLGATVRGFVEQWAHWIAFALLVYIGSRMLKEALCHHDEQEQRDPTRGASLIMLSVATSIDALAVGLSLSLLGVSIWQPALVIGIVCLAFTAAGLHLGHAFTRFAAFSRYAEVAGGIVLILIGIDIVRRSGCFG